MEKIVKRLFLGGTLLVALAVSLTAFSTYAADDDTQASGQTNFKLSVQSSLALSNVTSVEWEQANVGVVNEKDITADVVSNSAFVVKVHADATQNHTPELVMTTDASQKIPTTSDVKGGVSGWGIKNNVSNAYQAVTANPETFYTGASTKGATSNIALPVGIGVSPTQAYGTYSTVVTLTLAAAQ